MSSTFWFPLLRIAGEGNMTAVYEQLTDAHSKDRYLLASKSEKIDMASFCEQKLCTKGEEKWSGDSGVTIEVGP